MFSLWSLTLGTFVLFAAAHGGVPALRNESSVVMYAKVRKTTDKPMLYIYSIPLLFAYLFVCLFRQSLCT